MPLKTQGSTYPSEKWGKAAGIARPAPELYQMFRSHKRRVKESSPIDGRVEMKYYRPSDTSGTPAHEEAAYGNQ